jgi:AcrR family transcriptional regulator
MNAAERLFLKHGVEPTTIEQITMGADVAKGTFYLYFSSKEDVLEALRERFGQKLLAGIKAAVDRERNGDWKKKLAAWAAAGVAGYIESIRLHDILFYGSRPPTRKGLVKNAIIDHLAELLKAGIDAGAWSVEDPHFTAIFLFSGLHSAVDYAYSEGKRIDRGPVTRKLQQACLRAVEVAQG